MRDGPHISGIASLIGEPARAEMLTALLADRALTATELADIAGVSKATASTHLAKLRDAGLLAVQDQGRHRYFRLADRDVAQLLESLMGVAFRTGAVRLKSSPREPALRRARVCYDHLAGELGVQAFEALCARGAFRSDAQGLHITAAGTAWFTGFGVDAQAVGAQRRMPPSPDCGRWPMSRADLRDSCSWRISSSRQKVPSTSTQSLPAIASNTGAVITPSPGA